MKTPHYAFCVNGFSLGGWWLQSQSGTPARGQRRLTHPGVESLGSIALHRTRWAQSWRRAQASMSGCSRWWRASASLWAWASGVSTILIKVGETLDIRIVILLPSSSSSVQICPEHEELANGVLDYGPGYNKTILEETVVMFICDSSRFHQKSYWDKCWMKLTFETLSL